MLAVLKREFNGYFTSPIGYVFVAVMFLLSGVFFVQIVTSGLAEMAYLYSSLYSVLTLLVPILTMRLMSEDKKNKTDQVLLTAPVSLFGIVMGKFFAAYLVFLLSTSITVVQCIVLGALAVPEWPVIFSNILGLMLLGAALIAIGMFISSLTENQVIAAVATYAVTLLITMMPNLIPSINISFLKDLMTGASFTDRYASFVIGIIDLSNIVFFLSFVAVFVFLTIRVLEKKRWS